MAADLKASQDRFLQITHAESVVRDRKAAESEAVAAYTKAFSTLAVSKLIWTLTLDHEESLIAAWYKTVRPSRFGNVDIHKFVPVWSEFIAEVVAPAVNDMCEQHGDAAREGVAEAVTTERPFVFEHLLEVASVRDVGSAFASDMTPLDYERLCARMLRERGWDARTTVGSGDQGVDVLAEREGVRLVLQCKLYSKPVGNKAVQEAVAARGHERAHVAAVVSNAGFTRSAEDLAATNAIALLHHSELTAWAERLSKNQ